MGFQDEGEFEHRSFLREYASALQEYAAAAPDKRTELEARLQTQKSELEAKQRERRDHFAHTFGPFKLGMYIRDLGVEYVLPTLRRWRRDISEIPTGFGFPSYDGPFFEERRYLEDAIIQLEEVLKKHGVNVEVEPAYPRHPAERVAAQIQQTLAAITALEGQREQELRNAPSDHHEYIKRAYGKAIDALKQQL